MSKLLRRTRELLIQSDERLEDIATNTGLKFSWLVAMRGNYHPQRCPTVDKVEALYEYLSGKELGVD